MYPRTAKSTNVQVMSRGWTLSSGSAPVSAGVMPAGGSYMGATETPGSGSRPLYHHSTNITPRVTRGRNTIGLLPKNHIALVNELGGFRMPLGMNTSTVRPPRMGRGCVVSNETSDSFTSEVASVCCDPYTPVKACARSEPAAAPGKLTSAVAWAIGTGQSFPVTFQ